MDWSGDRDGRDKTAKRLRWGSLYAMGTRAPSLGVNRPGREVNHSPPSRAEVKECVELYLHSANTPSWRGAQLKHRDNFTFTFTSWEDSRKSKKEWNDNLKMDLSESLS
jgi:hypothetical protein